MKGADDRVLYKGSQGIPPMSVILSGADVRMALMDRRSELIRCSAITKNGCFDEQIKELDDAIHKLWDAIEVALLASVD